jgi:hypothetical protein
LKNVVELRQPNAWMVKFYMVLFTIQQLAV